MDKPFLILSEGYHGMGDEWISLTPPALGIPPIHAFTKKLSEDFTFEEIREADAVILEPVMLDATENRRKWLLKLRDFCTKTHTVLIFDEIVTGFRWPRFSVANEWEIEPDIILLGKAMANGLPISCVAGKRDIMNCGEYFVSSTFAGETLSLVAAKKTMELLQTKYKLQDLWEKGQLWLHEFNSFAPEKIRIDGYPTRGRFEGDAEFKALFFQEACEAGILFGPSWFFNFPLAEETQILSTLKEIICRIQSGNVKLKGEMPRSPFAEQMRKAS